MRAYFGLKSLFLFAERAPLVNTLSPSGRLRDSGLVVSSKNLREVYSPWSPTQNSHQWSSTTRFLE